MRDPEIIALRERLAARVHAPAIADRRRDFDLIALIYPTARDIVVTPVDAGGVRAEWSVSTDAAADRAVLYLHGGGYVIGSLASHRHLVAEIGRAAGARALALDYRLAPEHPFPAAVEDALAGYRFLLAQGFAPERIALAGDSAGGGLVVATLVAIRDAGLRQPGGGYCLSPWVDLEGIGASMTTNAARDPIVQLEPLLEMSAHYLHGADPRSPLAAPLHADLHGIAPLFIQVGAAETLLDDATRLAGAAGAADVAVSLECWPEMIHVWPLFHPDLAAGRRAIAAGGAFLRRALAGGTAGGIA